MMSPLHTLFLWLRGLFAIAVLWAGIYAGREWYNRSHVRVDTGRREYRNANPPAAYRFDPDFNWDATTALFAGAALAVTYSLGGGLFVTRLLLGRRAAPGEVPTDADAQRYTHARRPGAGLRVRRPDGSEIEVTVDDGPAGAPTLVLLHGWGLNAKQWNAVHPDLRGRFRTVAWDAPGLGDSDKRPDGRYSPDTFAHDLRLVLDAADGRGPVVLIGHSIGAMTLLSFCRAYPDLLGPRVAGVVIAHGTYTNPLKTIRGAAIYTALQKPVIEPILWLTVFTWPLVYVLQYLTYLNGSTHRSTHRSGFSGRESRAQLDFAARFALQANPGVVARGTLGMLHWDASEVPPTIKVPTLFIAGGKDPTTKPEASETMRAQAPDAELYVLPEAGHLGPIEFAREFAHHVAAFATAHATAGETPARAPTARHDRGRHGDADSGLKTSPDTLPADGRVRAYDDKNKAD